jgi:hypothetical protein
MQSDEHSRSMLALSEENCRWPISGLGAVMAWCALKPKHNRRNNNGRTITVGMTGDAACASGDG